MSDDNSSLFEYAQNQTAFIFADQVAKNAIELATTVGVEDTMKYLKRLIEEMGETDIRGTLEERHLSFLEECLAMNDPR